jgi:iron complex transport system substrate-binding protein
MSSGVSIDKVALVGWNPGVIFISPVSIGIIENELKTSPFKELKAIQENKIHYVLPFCWYSYNKENAIVDAYYVGKLMYPEAFQDVDVDQKGVEIFKKFYGDSGKDVYYKLKERFNAFENQKGLLSY